MSNTLIRLEEVTKTYRSGPETIVILERLYLSVSPGESVAITGPSGSGKTTLLNIMGGLDRADSGRVFLADRELSDLDETALADLRGAKIGFVFQFHYLLRDFTAVENVMFPALIAGMARKRAVERAGSLLRLVGLDARAGHYPHELSGGERQRVALARALVNDPPVVLADEPTGNLDPKHSREIQDLVFSMSDSLGKTLVLVSHDPELASRATRHLVLEGGVLEEL